MANSSAPSGISYGLHRYGLYKYGLYSYCVFSYGLCSYGVFSYGRELCAERRLGAIGDDCQVSRPTNKAADGGWPAAIWSVADWAP